MIRVRELRRSYGDVDAVRGISFEIGSGEVVGFLGPNGAGKSTTLRILAGAGHADAGEVEVAGARLPDEGLRARARVGYLPERTPLYTAQRVDRFLDFAARARGIRAGERRAECGRAMELAGLGGFERRRIGELSKGYRQRVGLAQALLGDPPVLLLDEPTSGLDPLEGRRMRERIAELGATKTVLLSTHVLSEVEDLCGRVLMLFAGRLVADGTLDELAAGARPTVRVELVASDDRPLPAAEDLAGLPGVDSAEGAPGSGAGTRAYRIVCGDRALLARSLAELGHTAGFVVTELAPERTSLERVFSERALGAAGGHA